MPLRTTAVYFPIDSIAMSALISLTSWAVKAMIPIGRIVMIHPMILKTSSWKPRTTLRIEVFFSDSGIPEIAKPNAKETIRIERTLPETNG